MDMTYVFSLEDMVATELDISEHYFENTKETKLNPIAH